MGITTKKTEIYGVISVLGAFFISLYLLNMFGVPYQKQPVEVCRVIKTVHHTVYTNTNSTHADASFSIIDFHEKGGLSIEVNKENFLGKSVRISISRTFYVDREDLPTLDPDRT
jgi:hypothetical protein